MKGYRVAVVGPLSPFGQQVRRLVEDGDFPAIEIKLFEPTLESSSTLTQFQDDVLVTQTLDADLLSSLDVIFVGEGTGKDALALVASAAGEGVLTFVADKGLTAPLTAHGLNEKFLPPDARLVGVPSTASILIGKVLDGIAGTFEIQRAFATALLPASELGDRGAQELHQQVVQILNFGTPSTEVLGEQLAFNLLPPSEQPGGESPEATVAKEAAELKRALSLIPRPHEALHRSGNSAHPRRRVGIFEALSRILDFAKALGLEPFEFLRHGRFEHGSEVGTRHERREPLELVVKLGLYREGASGSTTGGL